jgi:YHS domain-containing protein
MKKVLLVPILAILVVIAAYNMQSQDKSKKEKIKSTTESCGTEMESCGGCGGEAKVQTTSARPWNSVCPVLGEKVDPKVKTVKYNGKEYGFCCAGCDVKFQKDPAKYAKNLSKDGKTFASK